MAGIGGGAVMGGTGLLIGLWALGGAAEAACEVSVAASALSQQMSLAEAAYVNLEAEAFAEHLAAVRAGIPCLDAPFNRAQATALFRLEALSAFLARDPEGVQMAFWAVLEIAPQYSLSPSLAPEGHPLRAGFDAAVEGQAPLTTLIEAPREGTLWIDGGPSTGSVPLSRPYLFQWVDAEGVLVISTVVSPGQAPPGYPTARAQAVGRRWATVAGASVLVAGSTWALARRSEAQFADLGTPTDELAALRTRTNVLSATSMGVGVLAVGTGVTAVLVRTW